jgi:hypothetical protein
MLPTLVQMPAYLEKARRAIPSRTLGNSIGGGQMNLLTMTVARSGESVSCGYCESGKSFALLKWTAEVIGLGQPDSGLWAKSLIASLFIR